MPESGDRSTNLATVARLVAGDVRGEPLLEDRPGPIHAVDRRNHPAFIALPSLRTGTAGSFAGVAAIPGSLDDPIDPFGSHLLRERFFPAQNAR